VTWNQRRQVKSVEASDGFSWGIRHRGRNSVSHETELDSALGRKAERGRNLTTAIGKA